MVQDNLCSYLLKLEELINKIKEFFFTEIILFYLTIIERIIEGWSFFFLFIG